MQANILTLPRFQRAGKTGSYDNFFVADIDNLQVFELSYKGEVLDVDICHDLTDFHTSVAYLKGFYDA